MRPKLFQITLICCLLVTSLFSGGAVFARDSELPATGITPDSPFYFLDKWGKGLGMFFAFGDEAKAKKALDYGEERLAEAESMAGKDRIREMERAVKDYQGYMETVNERLENGGVSDNVSERVCLAASHHLTVLERVREHSRNQAGDAIANAENASVNGQISALRALAKHRIQHAAELAADAVDRHMERARWRMLDNATSDNSSSGNNTVDMVHLLDIIDRIGELEDELIAKAGELGIDVTPILERLAQSTSNRLGALSDVYDNAPEAARNGIENAIGNSVRQYERAMEQLRVRNAAGNVPDEAAVKNQIREEVRERLQITIHNVEGEPQDTVRITTQTQNQEQNGQGFANNENGNNGNGASNQTGGQQQNQGKDNNGKHGN